MLNLLNKHYPVLGVCYGAQLTAKQFGGIVEKSNKREYGRAQLQLSKPDIIFEGMSNRTPGLDEPWRYYTYLCLKTLKFWQQPNLYLLLHLEKKTMAHFHCMHYSFTPKCIILPKAKRLSIISLSIFADARKTGRRNAFVQEAIETN